MSEKARSVLSETQQRVKRVPLSALLYNQPMLQTAFWAEFKSHSGWIPHAFYWEIDDLLSGYILVLERRFPGGFVLAYVPYGPALPVENPEHISSFLGGLAGNLKPHLSKKCFLLRYDLCGGTVGTVSDPPSLPLPLQSPLSRAPGRIQPEHTLILPLRDRTEDSVLKSMHKKSRYNIRLAERKGVNIRCLQNGDALSELPVWYELYQETARRDHIVLHTEDYYKRLLTLAGEMTNGPEISLYMADYQGVPLAGIITARSGKRVTYMYGASSSQLRELMPNHLLQWRAIQDAMNKGAYDYDFFGLPPGDDPAHPMHGLWRFKTGFGGNIHHYHGAWDFSYFPLVSFFYRKAETLRGYLKDRHKTKTRNR